MTEPSGQPAPAAESGAPGAKTFALPAWIAQPGVVWIALLVAAYGALQYSFVLGMSFVNDDYNILDKVSRATFTSLWTSEHPLWRWYRPWSRELHFWWLARVFGPRELPFHLASFALWIGVLATYYAFVRRVQGEAAAAIAVAGAAALAAWGSALSWAAGVQDLWMILLALLYLHAVAARRRVASLLALAGALLSKETAAVLPGIALLYAIVIDRDRPAAALRRVAPHLAVVALWAVAHPFLRVRLTGSPGAQGDVPATWFPGTITLRTLLSFVNLDQWPAPDLGWLGSVLPSLPGVLLLAAGTVWALHRARPSTAAFLPPVLFALGWLVLAAVPLFMPSVGWLSYYALLCALGAWAVLGGLMARWPGVAVGIVTSVAALQPVHAHTPSYEWASDWSMRRAAFFVAGLKQYMLQRHPTLPPRSRLYFASTPNGTGIGQPWFNPAFRVWYRDSTLVGDFIRNYSRRPAGEPQDRDYFFRFLDKSLTWIEVVKGPEDIGRERGLNPEWETDHHILAVGLGNVGDWRGSADEIEKLMSAFPAKPAYPYNLSICLGNLGDSLGMKRYRRIADSLQAALRAGNKR